MLVHVCVQVAQQQACSPPQTPQQPAVAGGSWEQPICACRPQQTLQQSFVTGAAEEQPTCHHIGTLSQTRIADCDALAVALICYAAWGGLPSCPRTLLLSPAFPPIGHCVTCNRLGRTGIQKPTEVCGFVNLVCGGFKHIYTYIFDDIYMYIYTLTMRIYTLEGARLRLPNYGLMQKKKSWRVNVYSRVSLDPSGILGLKGIQFLMIQCIQ